MIYANKGGVNLTFDQLQNDGPGMSEEASTGLNRRCRELALLIAAPWNGVAGFRQ
jgi:hypothetical protein